MVRSIFGTSWEELRLDDVAAFLAEQRSDEGLTWEAKGPNPGRLDEVDPNLSFQIRKAACGLANAQGGFVLIGARWDKKAEAWQLPGVVIEREEPKTWLIQLLRAHLRPLPAIDAIAWPVDDARTFAVVRVDAVPEPPCITSGGQIYERVSGQTVPVTEPLELARLFGKGEAAHTRAGDRAFKPLGEELHQLAHKNAGIGRDDESIGVLLSAGAIEYELDARASLFTEAAADDVRRISRERLWPNRYDASKRGFTLDVTQNSLSVKNHYRDIADGGRAWLVRLGWDGSVTLKCATNDEVLGIELLFEDIVTPAWRAASELLGLLGGRSTTNVVIAVYGTGKIIHAQRAAYIGAGHYISRWVAEAAPDPEVLDGLKRELLRSLGYAEWEPSP